MVLNLKSTFVNINLTELITVTIYRNVLEYIVPVVDLNYPQVSQFIPRQVCQQSNTINKLNLWLILDLEMKKQEHLAQNFTETLILYHIKQERLAQLKVFGSITQYVQKVIQTSTHANTPTTEKSPKEQHHLAALNYSAQLEGPNPLKAT